MPSSELSYFGRTSQLAIAGATGVALAAAWHYFAQEPPWPTVAFSLELAALTATVLGIAALSRAATQHRRSLDDLLGECANQNRAVASLQQELEAHRQLEQELTEAKLTAEAAMMTKGEFLATMSHEIRTPLNGIIPMLDLLMSSKLSADQYDILHTAHISARQMLRIVDDILDYSKLEANKLQLESTNFNLRDLINSVLQLMEKLAESKGLRLERQIDPSVRLAVRGDPVRLRQVLTNLLSNAIKFTERGSISLQVTRKGETRTRHELRFEVRDSGVGIDKQSAQNLFRAFSQADASTTRLYGGTGLGLVICKRIIDLMGGTIGVESELGRGATFWFEIPLLKASGDIQEQRAELDDCRILLLSNDQALRHRLRQAVASWNGRLTETETTQEALTRLRNAVARGDKWAFDVLMVDLPSVRSTAIALHRNLLRTPELADLHVAYLYGDEPPPPELTHGQHILLLQRTIGNTELRAAVTNLLSAPLAGRGDEQAAILPAPTIAEGGLPRLHGHVLLAEDNPVNQMVAQRLVSILGLDCETADNGVAALERMATGQFDLVIMDCQMPIKDGYTATREWRRQELAGNLGHLPIIAMTANSMAGDRQKCLEAGMDDYLSKPVDRFLLEAVLTRWLPRSPLKTGSPSPNKTAAIAPARISPSVAPEPSVKAPGAPGTPASAEPATPVSAIGSTPPVLAGEVVEELRALMGREYLSLVKLFLEDAPVHIEQLESAAAANDIAAMVAPAHTLKSSSANLGALALSAAAKRIEAGARAGSLTEPIAAVLLLKREFRNAYAALHSLLKT